MQRTPQGPTIWQKRKMGAAMGCGVGLTIGFLFGGFSILRGGAGPRGVLPTLSQYMLTSAATFGFFLAIGSVIRNDSHLPPHLEAARLQMASPLLRTRADGLALMRSRWDAERRRDQQ
ncbi:reactive mitochondrial oxygen species modulator 1-domain-containing protein [Fomitopsis serialis]|uniref:reactive mitochondrial oxygen species modulator 1-domain-containing protein n=1 Tax=Fomitopsis serialis TaxID=139415 RepID=UPI002007DAF2|nr:reactive mitochondrial oxygen species modulator 1-domain-containing protein [Neoantrodia serialis]KAH9921443.1 reactive mitochondrial oxygen species modulator 1-domain-containing protein [Neoantrodia serialis]